MPLSSFKLFNFTSRDYKPSSTEPEVSPLDQSRPPPSLSRPTLAPHFLSLDSESTNKEKGIGVGHLSVLMGHNPTPRRIRSRSPHHLPTDSRDSAIRPRSLSRRRYELPEVSQTELEGCPYCPEGGKRSDRERGVTARSKSTTDKDGGKTRRSSRSSSTEGIQGNTSGGKNRAPLFDDVDVELEVDLLSLSSTSSSSTSSSDEDDEEEASIFSHSSPPTSAYSLGRSPSSIRKSSLSTTATSDPLISPSSIPSVPVLSFGSPSHQRGHWLPATPEKIPAPSHQSQFAPSLPDPPPLPLPSIPLSTSPEKQGTSLRRASSFSPSTVSRPSLLSRSLRSLASLPNLNLTLPNLLPQFPRPDIYLTNSDASQSAPSSLTTGWGAKERRRVLDSEPSWDADEARGLLGRRGRRFPGLLGDAVDEVEATLFASTNGGISLDADLALSDFTPPPPPSLPDIQPPPLVSTPPPPIQQQQQPQQPPPQRFISNTRHLLMLSIEFSMMRADKISSPLRPRAVIVRNGGSPTRDGLGKSRLRNEVKIEV
ncbi:uncharacterized protein JCM6883_007609 [Sporobolomyces salmoneus]|uniref:uncharacterized protein n=1 Tax=Sporobolomyces salmoneus TaxID=183962 RepID=UPI0031706719